MHTMWYILSALAQANEIHMVLFERYIFTKNGELSETFLQTVFSKKYISKVDRECEPENGN